MLTLHPAELLREPVVLPVLLSPQQSKNRLGTMKNAAPEIALNISPGRNGLQGG